MANNVITISPKLNHIHRLEPVPGEHYRIIDAKGVMKSDFIAIRECVEHVFGYEKGPMALTIRSIGQTRANARMTMANLSYNFRRLIFHERRQATA